MEGLILKLLKNRALTKIFGSEGQEVRGGSSRLVKEWLRDLYSSLDGIRCVREGIGWAWLVAFTRSKRDAYSVLVRKPEEKRSPGKLRRKLKCKIKIQHVFFGVDCIHVAQDRDIIRAFVSTVMNNLFNKRW